MANSATMIAQISPTILNGLHGHNHFSHRMQKEPRGSLRCSSVVFCIAMPLMSVRNNYNTGFLVVAKIDIESITWLRPRRDIHPHTANVLRLLTTSVAGPSSS
mmetsp:Transcript_23667/g.43738  ORF Transcript_23667/g.43738 Transcript_23667/m.43738 type:complete len:103 (+) Transcript_23667:855-1163(+)